MNIEEINRLMEDGKKYFFSENYQEAHSCFEKALKTLALQTEYIYIKAEALRYLGRTTHSQGKYAEAEPLLRQALALYSSEEVSKIAITYVLLGDTYQRREKYLEAKTQYENALNQYSTKEASSNQKDIAYCLFSLGTIWWRLQTQEPNEWYVKASEYFDKALNLLYRLEGINAENNAIAEILLWYGKAYYSKGLYPQAEKNFKDALIIRAADKEILQIAAEWHWLGNAYFKQGRYKYALFSYKTSLNTWREVYGHRHPDIGDTLIQIGHVYQTMEHHNKAEKYYKQAAIMYPANHSKHKNIVEYLKQVCNQQKFSVM